MDALAIRQIFSNGRSNAAVEVGKDFLTLLHSVSNVRMRLLRVELYGMGTSSSPVEIMVCRSRDDGTGATHGASSYAFEPEGESLAVASSAWNWVTQPTIEKELFSMVVNVDGGVAVWEANKDNDAPTENDDMTPGPEVNFSFRAVSGVGPITLVVLFDQWNN